MKTPTWADLALVSAMALQRKAVVRIIERAKGMGLKIVAGGPLFTSEPEAFEEVDHRIALQAAVGYGYQKIGSKSTLRFLAMFSAESLGAAGLDSPYPLALRRVASIPASTI